MNLFEAAKSVPIRQVIEKFSGIALSNKKAYENIVCPLGTHNDSSPSFHIYDETNTFYCFGCGNSGTAIDYLMILYGIVEPEEASKMICSTFSIPYTDTPPDEGYQLYVDVYKYCAELFVAQYVEHMSQTNPHYFEQRKLQDLIGEYYLGYCPDAFIDSSGTILNFKNDILRKKFPSIPEATLDSFGLYNKKYGDCLFAGRYIFTIFDGKKNPVGFSGRAIGELTPKYYNTPETPYFKKKNLLYNYSTAKAYKEIYIVEAPADALSLIACGIKNVVAIMGSALTEEQLELMNNKDIILAFDNDSTGRKKMFSLIESSKAIKYKVFDCHQYGKAQEIITYKDFNEALIAGVDLSKVVNPKTTVYAPVFALCYLKETLDLTSLYDRETLYKKVCYIARLYSPIVKDYVAVKMQRLLKGERK